MILHWRKKIFKVYILLYVKNFLDSWLVTSKDLNLICFVWVLSIGVEWKEKYIT